MEVSFNLLKVFTLICNSFLSQECIALLKGVSTGVYLIKIHSKVGHLTVHCYKRTKRFSDPTLTFLRVLSVRPPVCPLKLLNSSNNKWRVFCCFSELHYFCEEHERWTVTGVDRCRTEKQELMSSGNRRLTSLLEELKHMHTISNHQCLLLQNQTAWIDLELPHFYAFSITEILILHYLWLFQVLKPQQHFKIYFSYWLLSKIFWMPKSLIFQLLLASSNNVNVSECSISTEYSYQFFVIYRFSALCVTKHCKSWAVTSQLASSMESCA